MTVGHNIYTPGYVRPERFETEPSQPSPYRYILANTITHELIAEVPFIGVSYGGGVSRAGEFSGTIPLTGMGVVPGLDLYRALLPIKTSLYVIRKGSVVWGGTIWSRNYSLTGKSIGITGASFESYLFRRHIWHTLTYANTVDQYQVVRHLIDAMQEDFAALAVPEDPVTPYPANADIGITYQLDDSGKTQDAQTFAAGNLRSFGEAIQEFANNLDGFEWNIHVDWDPDADAFIREFRFRDTPPGQLPTGVAYTGDRPGLQTNILEWPGNILDITLDESGDNSATRYFMVGSAPEGIEGDFRPMGAWENQPYLADDWPLVEVVNSGDSEATLQATLEKYAQVLGRRVRPVVPTWSVSINGSADPEIGVWKLGDWCRLVINDDFIESRLRSSLDYTQDETIKRIMGYSVTVPDVPQEPETVTLSLADEWVDEGT
jgi:hypothetical protein